MSWKQVMVYGTLVCISSTKIVSSVPLAEDEVENSLENTEQQIRDVLAGAENHVESVLPESIQASMCPHNNTRYVSIGNACYFFGTVELTFEGAKSFCSNKFGIQKGKLWEPKTIMETKQVYAKAKEVSKSQHWWIGVSDLQTEGTFRYESTGNIVHFAVKKAPWYKTEPNSAGGNEDCVAMHKDHPTWHDNGCLSKRYPICEQGSCLVQNTDFNGNDITPVTKRVTNSWQECDALCNQFTQCNYWTWKGPQWLGYDNYGYECWLKTSNEGISQQNGVFSGPKGCSSGRAISENRTFEWIEEIRGRMSQKLQGYNQKLIDFGSSMSDKLGELTNVLELEDTAVEVIEKICSKKGVTKIGKVIKCNRNCGTYAHTQLNGEHYFSTLTCSSTSCSLHCNQVSSCQAMLAHESTWMIECSETSTCQSLNATCTEGKTCFAKCSGTSSCQGAVWTGNWLVECSGPSSC